MLYEGAVLQTSWHTQLVSISRILCGPKSLHFSSARLCSEKLLANGACAKWGEWLEVIKEFVRVILVGGWFVFLSRTLLHRDEQYLLSIGLCSYTYPKMEELKSQNTMHHPQKSPKPTQPTKHHHLPPQKKKAKTSQRKSNCCLSYAM